MSLVTARLPVTQNPDNPALLVPATPICNPDGSDIASGTRYVPAPAGTTTSLGTGAIGDLLNSVTIVPATTSPGAVQIKDGSGAAITIFTGGATSVGSLVPFTVYLGAKSTAGGWSVICGANVSAIGVGSFT